MIKKVFNFKCRFENSYCSSIIEAAVSLLCQICRKTLMIKQQLQRLYFDFLAIQLFYQDSLLVKHQYIALIH